MGPAFVRGISASPEEARRGTVPVYGPEAIRQTEKGYEFVVRITGTEVPLPFINVGTEESPVWLAYAHVKENQTLARLALPVMASRVMAEFRRDPEVRFTVAPQSDKSEDFTSGVSSIASRLLGRKIPHVQLVGGTDMAKVTHASGKGLVTDCISVVSKAKGIVKYMGMTERDAALIRKLGGKGVLLDDVANTEETKLKAHMLMNRALGLPEETPHKTHVIFLESLYYDASGYPREVTGIQALGHLPEFVGRFPEIPSQ